MNELNTSLIVTQHRPRQPVVVLEAQGNLGPSTYLQLVDVVREAHDHGWRDMILDIRKVPSVGLSGIFALLSVALIYAGQEPPDPAGGTAAIRAAAERLMKRAPEHFRLLVSQPNVRRTLDQVGLPSFDDLNTALASLPVA